jgi:hypothetical protein
MKTAVFSTLTVAGLVSSTNAAAIPALKDIRK